MLHTLVAQTNPELAEGDPFAVRKLLCCRKHGHFDPVP